MRKNYPLVCFTLFLSLLSACFIGLKPATAQFTLRTFTFRGSSNHQGSSTETFTQVETFADDADVTVTVNGESVPQTKLTDEQDIADAEADAEDAFDQSIWSIFGGFFNSLGTVID